VKNERNRNWYIHGYIIEFLNERKSFYKYKEEAIVAAKQTVVDYKKRDWKTTLPTLKVLEVKRWQKDNPWNTSEQVVWPIKDIECYFY